jgi:hypothetical protein
LDSLKGEGNQPGCRKDAAFVTGCASVALPFPLLDVWNNVLLFIKQIAFITKKALNNRFVVLGFAVGSKVGA